MAQYEGQQRSAISWLTSLALHLLLLILLVLLLTPRGRTDSKLVLELSTLTETEAQPDVLVSLPLEPAIELNSQDIVLPIPTAESSFEIADTFSRPDPQDIAAALGAPIKSGSADYFGISATGNRFVYALDMSTSMSARSRHSNDGSRFERAVAELLRSVSALDSEQLFGVVLFCHRTRHMFDDRAELPDLVPATEKNKRKLRKWLAKIRLGPGTDPRLSIFRAMRMQPSAIFLLSDGEFNGHLSHRRLKTIVGNPTVQDIILAWQGERIPIHTIAYEDQVNRATMEEIAALTGGSFKFVSSGFRQPGSLAARAAKLLQSAKRMERRGDAQVALERYQHIVEKYAGTPAAETAHELLSKREPQL